MRKSTQRIAEMRFRSLYRLSFLPLLLLAGCTGSYSLWNLHDDEAESYYQPVEPIMLCEENAPCGSAQQGMPAAANAPMVIPPEETPDRFVNYRRSAADYREYGERTPQDQMIVTAGAGSILSAAIPPTIDEEVSDYEESVSMAFEDAEASANDDGDNAEASLDDAVEDWLAEEGATLKGLLSEWCERAGWRLIWNTNRNYTLSAGAMFRGRFADVSSALIRTFARARPAPLATFYKGNRVLVVETKEDENAYN